MEAWDNILSLEDVAAHIGKSVEETRDLFNQELIPGILLYGDWFAIRHVVIEWCEHHNHRHPECWGARVLQKILCRAQNARKQVE